MIYWRKLTAAEQEQRILSALNENINYSTRMSLGIPASRLDPFVFHDQATFLKDAPLLQAYVQNANHIGCHTLGQSEHFFRGTQELEREVIELLSVDLLLAAPESCDGYISAGGTEANIQAAWIYRNYFKKAYQARQDQIALIGSEDTHYSIAKAANLLHLQWFRVPVHPDTRAIDEVALDRIIDQAMTEGIRYFIVISNKGSTMFGSIDQPELYAEAMQAHQAEFMLHVDGAFGGFMVRPDDPTCTAHFGNPYVNSITLDAHKMLQAPYGTGIFIIRKGWMQYAVTQEAQYVAGADFTLSGSRSGANAIAVWMILASYGPFGWLEKINKLLYRTRWCCTALDKLGVRYFNRPGMNIITIHAADIPSAAAAKFGLVPDNHEGTATWYKIVVMDHVEIEHLQQFILEVQRMRAAGQNVV